MNDLSINQFPFLGSRNNALLPKYKKQCCVGIIFHNNSVNILAAHITLCENSAVMIMSAAGSIINNIASYPTLTIMKIMIYLS